MTEVQHKTGSIGLGAIPYRISVHEGLVSFSCKSGMSNTQISVRKCEPHGLLYVHATDHTEYVPYCHIEDAVEIAEHFLGPNHFLTLKDKHTFTRRNAANNIARNLRMWKFYGLQWRVKNLWWVIRETWFLCFPEPAPHIRWYEPSPPPVEESEVHA